jgi:hypothetical protein
LTNACLGNDHTAVKRGRGAALVGRIERDCPGERERRRGNEKEIFCGAGIVRGFADVFWNAGLCAGHGEE